MSLFEDKFPRNLHELHAAHYLKRMAESASAALHRGKQPEAVPREGPYTSRKVLEYQFKKKQVSGSVQAHDATGPVLQVLGPGPTLSENAASPVK